MIARIWHGWTKPEDAKRYEDLIRDEIFPGIFRIQGYQGAYLLRRESGNEIEFVTITLWDSMDAIRAFAGEDYSKAVIHGEGGKCLSHYDERSVHYEIVVKP